DPPQGEVGRGRSREVEASPGALEGRRTGRPPGWDLLLRGDAPPVRREYRRGSGGRGAGGDPRMVGPDRRRGTGFGPHPPAVAWDTARTGPSRSACGPSPVSDDRLRLVAVRHPPGPGRLPGRRHGPGQDHPGDRTPARPEARRAEEREPAGGAGLADREL